MIHSHASLALLVAGAMLASCATPRVGAPPEQPATSSVPDAITTNPEKYTVVLQNDRVRILDYRDKPGDNTSMHRHPDFVLVVVSPFKRRITLPDGSSREREFHAGEVIAMKSETHVGENIGTSDTHAILVEMK